MRRVASNRTCHLSFFVLKDPSLAVGCLYPIGHQENNIYARFLHHHAKAFHHIPLQSLILTML